MQRDARNFSFPDAFWPERWLIAWGHLALVDAPLPSSYSSFSSLPAMSKAELAQGFVHNEHAFLVFSHGPMNCPGKALALLEMRVVAIALVHTFREIGRAHV